MFQAVSKKLDVAGYFLWHLKILEKEMGVTGNITILQQVEIVANLDGFLFEVISAKDFFLQGINEKFCLGIQSNKLSEDKLMTCCSIPDCAKTVVSQIKAQLRTENTWLWKLNDYRNEATHRELLQFHQTWEGPTVQVKPGEEPQFQIVLDPDTKVPKYLRRIDIPSESYEYKYAGTYLLKKPSDPSQGHLDIKVADYCEQSLERMKTFLKELYAKLKI